MNTLIHFLFSSNRKIGLFLFMVSVLTFLNSFETVYSSGNIHANYFYEEIEQQQVSVRGVVTDASSGEPLIGANVIEKGHRTVP